VASRAANQLLNRGAFAMSSRSQPAKPAGHPPTIAEGLAAVAFALSAIVLALGVTVALGHLFVGNEHSVLIGWPR
jgi:hypothetical protein